MMAILFSFVQFSWWRHQMETFSALLAICAENSPVPGEFPAQRPVTRSFDVLFDLRPNKRLGKQSRGWWTETPSSSLWRHRNGSWCKCLDIALWQELAQMTRLVWHNPVLNYTLNTDVKWTVRFEYLHTFEHTLTLNGRDKYDKRRRYLTLVFSCIIISFSILNVYTERNFILVEIYMN